MINSIFFLIIFFDHDILRTDSETDLMSSKNTYLINFGIFNLILIYICNEICVLVMNRTTSSLNLFSVMMWKRICSRSRTDLLIYISKPNFCPNIQSLRSWFGLMVNFSALWFSIFSAIWFSIFSAKWLSIFSALWFSFFWQ